MSGEIVLASRNRKPTPMEERLAVEDDARLARFTGAGSILGACFAAWALTTHIVIPVDLRVMPPPPDDPQPPMIILPLVDYHGPIRRPRIAKTTVKPGNPGRGRGEPKTARPAEKAGWLGQNLISSRGDRLDVNAYDLIPAAMRNLDLDKLGELPVLKRTPHSGIGGRRGKVSHEFNVEYFEDGNGGSGGIIDVPSAIGGALRTEVKRPAGAPRASEIEMKQDGNARSTASILAVIRSRSPGLRHIYNSHLKLNPGFAGKINLSFEIAPGGDVVAVGIASSTTRVPEFDAEILRQVKSWRFDPVRASGNDHVTVPISFSE